MSILQCLGFSLLAFAMLFFYATLPLLLTLVQLNGEALQAALQCPSCSRLLLLLAMSMPLPSSAATEFANRTLLLPRVP